MVGDGFTHDDWTFEVLEMDRHRVATVRLVKAPPRVEGDAAAVHRRDDDPRDDDRRDDDRPAGNAS